ncbi:hypothetical protein, partial [Dysgonomonas sp. Marseille-P4677]|uniref:hypothetical protein n=1 Tax=Dysgonomonas sp. Marseille-P4677 TaxID=2364790 RepID=UPI001F2096B6
FTFCDPFYQLIFKKEKLFITLIVGQQACQKNAGTTNYDKLRQNATKHDKQLYICCLYDF